MSADAEAVERQGLAVFAVFSGGAAGEDSASRLAVSFLPLPRERSGTQLLSVSDGRKLPIERPGPDLDGAVVRVERADEQIVVSGWAADLAAGESARQVVLYRDGVFLAAATANENGPGGLDRRGGAGMERTGFKLAVPIDQGLASTEGLRLFAVMGRGAALELSLQ